MKVLYISVLAEWDGEKGEVQYRTSQSKTRPLLCLAGEDILKRFNLLLFGQAAWTTSWWHGPKTKACGYGRSTHSCRRYNPLPGSGVDAFSIKLFHRKTLLPLLKAYFSSFLSLYWKGTCSATKIQSCAWVQSILITHDYIWLHGMPAQCSRGQFISASHRCRGLPYHRVLGTCIQEVCVTVDFSDWLSSCSIADAMFMRLGYAYSVLLQSSKEVKTSPPWVLKEVHVPWIQVTWCAALVSVHYTQKLSKDLVSVGSMITPTESIAKLQYRPAMYIDSYTKEVEPPCSYQGPYNSSLLMPRRRQQCSLYQGGSTSLLIPTPLQLLQTAYS